MTENGPDLNEDPESGHKPTPVLNRKSASVGDGAGSRGQALRMAGLGTELATTTLVLAGIGYLVDSMRGHEKSYATALGTLVGFTLGMIRFIYQVQKNAED